MIFTNNVRCQMYGVRFFKPVNITSQLAHHISYIVQYTSYTSSRSSYSLYNPFITRQHYAGEHSA